MAQKRLTRDEALQTARTVYSFIQRGYSSNPGVESTEKGAERMAADALGLDLKTIKNRLNKAFSYYGIKVDEVPLYEAPEVPEDSDRPDPTEILRRHTKGNTDYIAKKRMKPAMFMVPPVPFAVAFVGDPHLTNAGCNLAALQEDIRLLRETGTRAVQMGDILDNFHKIAKLAPKEAENRMSLAEGQSLAQWLICETGVKWDAHILGNHDAWLGYEGVGRIADWVSRSKSRLFDWNARLIYKWGPGQHEQHHVFAAHDMKGHSEYNPTHGPGKMAMWDGTADTYVAAHRHNAAEAKVPNGWRGKTYQLVRVRGYKDHDSYGSGRAQFPDFRDMGGRSALLVIDPLSETHDGRQRVFMDIGEGLEFLNMKKRAA